MTVEDFQVTNEHAYIEVSSASFIVKSVKAAAEMFEIFLGSNSHSICNFLCFSVKMFADRDVRAQLDSVISLKYILKY